MGVNHLLPSPKQCINDNPHQTRQNQMYESFRYIIYIKVYEVEEVFPWKILA